MDANKENADQKARYAFPNYFISVKTHAKITKQEEQEATKLFLEDSKKDAKKNKKRPASSKKTRPQNNTDGDEQMKGEGGPDEIIDGCVDDDDGILKNEYHKNMVMKRLVNEMYPKMKYLLDSGFNLCLYGVGSKIDFLNFFVQQKL